MYAIAEHWKMFIVRGVLALLFALVAVFVPQMALIGLVFLFGIYAMADGIVNLRVALRKNHGTRKRDRMLVVSGVAGVVAGLLAFLMPALTAVALVFIIAAWAIVIGITTVVVAIRLRREIHGEWLLVVSGVLSVLLGVMLAAFPGAGAVALVLWIGAWAAVVGAMLIALGIRLRRRLRGEHGTPHDLPMPAH